MKETGDGGRSFAFGVTPGARSLAAGEADRRGRHCTIRTVSTVLLATIVQAAACRSGGSAFHVVPMILLAKL